MELNNSKYEDNKEDSISLGIVTSSLIILTMLDKITTVSVTGALLLNLKISNKFQEILCLKGQTIEAFLQEINT